MVHTLPPATGNVKAIFAYLFAIYGNLVNIHATPTGQVGGSVQIDKGGALPPRQDKVAIPAKMGYDRATYTPGGTEIMWYAILLAGAIGLDQLLKWWVTSHLEVG